MKVRLELYEAGVLVMRDDRERSEFIHFTDDFPRIDSFPEDLRTFAIACLRRWCGASHGDRVPMETAELIDSNLLA